MLRRSDANGRAASPASMPRMRPRRCRHRRRRSPCIAAARVERAAKRDALVRAIVRQQVHGCRAADDPDIGQRPNDRQDEPQRALVIGGGSVVHGQASAACPRRRCRGWPPSCSLKLINPLPAPGTRAATCRPTTRARDCRRPAAPRCQPHARKYRRAHARRSRPADSAPRRGSRSRRVAAGSRARSGVGAIGDSVPS